MTQNVPLENTLATFETGKRPKGGASSSGIPSLGGEHITAEHGIKLVPMKFVPESFYRSMNKGGIRAGDVLIVKDGATTGRIGMIETNFPFKEAAVNEHLFLLRPNPHLLDAQYLYFYLRSTKGQAEIMSDFRGAAQGGISREIGKKVRVPLLALDEQRRIVEILSRARGILRLRREAERKSAELIPALFLDMFGDPVTNPKGWPIEKLDGLLSSIDSGHSPVCHAQKRLNQEWCVLKLSALTGCEYHESEHKVLPEEAVPDQTVEVRRGDLLISRKNTPELVGTAAYVWGTQGKALLPDLIFRLNVADSSKLNSIYLWGLLTQPVKRVQIKALASGSAGSMPNISKARLKTLDIEVPPLDRQTAYAQALEQIISIRSQQATATAKAQATFDALLADAFKAA
jgi:type I restriction enzyme S subunit